MAEIVEETVLMNEDILEEVKLLRKKVDDMVSLKPNLKEYTPLIHTEEKLFAASLVAKLSVRSSI